jgi:chemotaxis protein CheZ
MAAAQAAKTDTSASEESPFAALITLSEKLKNTKSDSLSLTDVIGVAELLTSSLQPLLRRIDSTIHKELRGILSRIEGLRTEIAKVRADDISSKRIPEMGRELSAIVESTEGATNTIMESAEAVLSADATDAGYVDLVSEKMMAIFEACSFQDLTGQRVNKVVETVEIIETRVNLLCEMLDMNSFDGPMPEEEEMSAKEKRKKDLILNGPALKGEGVDQSDIDKLF